MGCAHGWNPDNDLHFLRELPFDFYGGYRMNYLVLHVFHFLLLIQPLCFTPVLAFCLNFILAPPPSPPKKISYGSSLTSASFHGLVESSTCLIDNLLSYTTSIYFNNNILKFSSICFLFLRTHLLTIII